MRAIMKLSNFQESKCKKTRFMWYSLLIFACSVSLTGQRPSTLAAARGSGSSGVICTTPAATSSGRFVSFFFALRLSFFRGFLF